MKPLIFTLGAAADLAERLCNCLDADAGELERRQFPDGESYVRLLTEVNGRDVVLLCSLDQPDAKILPLLFAAEAAREQGARSVGLAASYLAYLRQDKAFKPGEAITSRTFAHLLSQRFDWLATLDPHLHRYPTLDSIYGIPAAAASSGEAIAAWVCAHVQRPLLIGPDEESAQWVNRIAKIAGAPSAVFRKIRRGDFDVSLTLGDFQSPADATPVIVDDIASSAQTMIQAVAAVRNGGLPRPYCIAVHAIFAGDAYEKLTRAEIAGIVTTNSVAHASNSIDISCALAEPIRHFLRSGVRP